MLMRICVVLTFAISTCTSAFAQFGPQALKPYTLAPAVQRSANELAAQCDVLILGETHGTQEVPAVAAALLAPPMSLGYQVLAVEVPEAAGRCHPTVERLGRAGRGRGRASVPADPV